MSGDTMCYVATAIYGLSMFIYLIRIFFKENKQSFEENFNKLMDNLDKKIDKDEEQNNSKMKNFTRINENLSNTFKCYQDPECWYELETGEKVKENFVWEISKMFRVLEGEPRKRVYVQKENWFRHMENNDIKGVHLIDTGKLNKIKYVVSNGDNLSSLAVKFNTTSRKIAEANNIPNIHRIQTGQTLDIEYITKDGNIFYNEKLYDLLVTKKQIAIFCPESDQQLTLDYGNFLRFCLFLREQEIQEEINAENKRAEEIKQKRLEEVERKKDIIRDKHALATRFMQQQLMDDNVKSLDDMPLLLRKDFEIYAEILNSIQSERIKKDLERLKIKGDTKK